MRSDTEGHLVLVALIGLLAGCGGASSDHADANVTVAGSASTEPPSAEAGELTLPPKPTFEQHCARCHGPEGMFYAIPFQHEGEALRQIVADMMKDEAALDPTEADVDAMLDYHLQIRAERTGTP